VAYFLRIIRSMYMDTPAVVSAHDKRDLVPTFLYSGSLLLATVFITPIGAGLTQAAKQTADVDSYVQHIMPPAADQGGPI